MAFIYYESAQSVLPSFIPDSLSDKLLHVGGYALLGALCVRALSDRFRKPVTVAVALAAVLLTTTYGVSDEVHQSFVPLREADSWDVVADFVGGLVAALPLYVWFRPRGQRVR